MAELRSVFMGVTVDFTAFAVFILTDVIRVSNKLISSTNKNALN